MPGTAFHSHFPSSGWPQQNKTENLQKKLPGSRWCGMLWFNSKGPFRSLRVLHSLFCNTKPALIRLKTKGIHVFDFEPQLQCTCSHFHRGDSVCKLRCCIQYALLQGDLAVRHVRHTRSFDWGSVEGRRSDDVVYNKIMCYSSDSPENLVNDLA